jgi:hypothetical protein
MFHIISQHISFALISSSISLIFLWVRLARGDQSTCTKTIGHLRAAFSDQGTSSADVESVLDEFIELANRIQRALYEFDSTSNHAVLRLYNQANSQSPTSHGSTTASAPTDDNPFLSGSDNEHVFLVYLCVEHVTLFFFVFLLIRMLC